MDEVLDYIKNFGLSGTTIRKQIISCLWGDGVALTQKEIEERLPGDPDRVTLYRTLKLFAEKGIVHKIVIDEATQKYKLAGRFRKSDHAHFYCIQCHKILCMPQLNVDLKGLPSGFRFQSARVVVEGTCDFCASNQKV